MNQSIQDGLNDLFDQIIPISGDFNKKTYADSFKNAYEKYKSLFTEIAQECENSEDRQEEIEEIAAVLPDRMREVLDQESSKRKKENVLMKYNLGMVTYVIPMFRYGRMDACEEIVDCMIERWNDHDLELKISKSEFEQIQGGFKSRLCYITTAVCASLGKPDDCYELNLMRRYRDEYLVNQKGGEEIVAEYYDIAPTIVNRINRMENSEDVYAKENVTRHILFDLNIMKINISCAGYIPYPFKSCGMPPDYRIRSWKHMGEDNGTRYLHIHLLNFPSG